jgi:hypothetical protein
LLIYVSGEFNWKGYLSQDGRRLFFFFVVVVCFDKMAGVVVRALLRNRTSGIDTDRLKKDICCEGLALAIMENNKPQICIL